MSDLALRVEGLSKRYRNDFQALKSVSLQVKKGDFSALLGTNGAGKSTILNVITGLATPERGVVRLEGRTITFASAEVRGGLGIEMLLGGKGVWASMTIRENLEMGAFRYRRDPDDVERRIGRVLDLFPPLPRTRASEPATSPVDSSRCWRWRGSCSTNPTC